MNYRVKSLLMVLMIFVFAVSCNNEEQKKLYLTKNVIVIVIDGARYTETWGDTSHTHIPYLSNQLSKSGIINTDFYNNGPTYTIPGHVGISTGNYQEIDNSGAELPDYPSYFQCWTASNYRAGEGSWIIASKDKIEVLRDCKQEEYRNKYNPATSCGISGLGSGYRHDSVTYRKIKEILTEHHPNLVLINLREPDYSAHRGNWNNYVAAIKNSDEYAYKIWQFIQQDLYYQGTTTVFITNDHGRHSDGVADGFVSHGDDCKGCRHVMFYASGPDFKNNLVINRERELVDISATISELLGFDLEHGTGEVMYELFK